MLLLLSIVPWNNQLDVVRPAFSNRFLRWIGKYSYAIYIFHFPLKYVWFSYFAITVPPDAPWIRLAVVTYNFLGIATLAIAGALLSWHLVEYPFLKLKRYFVLQRSPQTA